MTEEIRKTSEPIHTKVLRIIEEMETELLKVKSVYDTLKIKHKQLKKSFQKMETKMNKKQKKSNGTRKPCGFAKPSTISKEMCEFLGITEGSLASRTQVTKKLIEYIKEKQLQGEKNKRIICPDETLYKIFGESAKKDEITYFTMQKYVNHHFIKEEKK
uniref:DM2 domain-containing protein n=1 Tax=viral metagenome TaxID=1070528 RepID=A0A6C0CKT7_9ZZZZ